MENSHCGSKQNAKKTLFCSYSSPIVTLLTAWNPSVRIDDRSVVSRPRKESYLVFRRWLCKELNMQRRHENSTASNISLCVRRYEQLAIVCEKRPTLQAVWSNAKQPQNISLFDSDFSFGFRALKLQWVVERLRHSMLWHFILMLTIDKDGARVRNDLHDLSLLVLLPLLWESIFVRCVGCVTCNLYLFILVVIIFRLH